MEALDIFFNDSKGIIKLEKNDVNMDSRLHGDTEISISVRFTDLPDRIVIDATCETTLAKLQEMSPDVASTLTPVIPPAESLKWTDVFKNVSIAGDESIPINKRGSGTKRLILLNFFRAEVERRQAETNNSCVIYAIEEPETSQHYGNQRKLIHALQSLAQAPNTQIIITTHSATIVKELGFSNIRIIRMDHAQKVVEHTLPSQLPYPSLNEVNYLAFGEVSEEYHNELYGYLEAQNLFNAYKKGKQLVPYTRVQRNGNTVQEQITSIRGNF